MDTNPIINWILLNVPLPKPAVKIPDVTIDDMLLSSRVRAALKRSGFRDLAQVYSTPRADLVSIRGVGASGCRELKETFEKDYNLPSRFL